MTAKEILVPLGMSWLGVWKKKEISPYLTHLGLAFKKKKQQTTNISVGSFCFHFVSSPVTHDQYLSILVFCSINRLGKKKKTKQDYVGSLSFQQHSLCRQYYIDKTANSSVLHSPKDRSTNSSSLKKKNPTTKQQNTCTPKKDLSLNSKITQFKTDHPNSFNPEKHQKGHTSSGTHWYSFMIKSMTH